MNSKPDRVHPWDILSVLENYCCACMCLSVCLSVCLWTDVTSCQNQPLGYIYYNYHKAGIVGVY